MEHSLLVSPQEVVHDAGSESDASYEGSSEQHQSPEGVKVKAEGFGV